MAVVLHNTIGTGYTVKTVTSTTSNTSITGDMPSGIEAGDYLLAILTVGQITSTANNIVAPAAFIPIFNNSADAAANVCDTYIGYFKYTGSEGPSFQFTFTGDTRDDQLLLIRVTGADAGQFLAVDAVGQGQSSLSPSCPSITTTGNNDLAVFVMSAINGSALAADDANNPSGTSLFFSKRTRSNTNGVNTGVATQLYAEPEATGTKTWTNYLTSTNRSTGVSFAIKEAGTGPSISLDSLSATTFDNAASITATISGNAAPGTVSLISGTVNVAQTVTSWNYNAGTDKTTVIIGIQQGGIKFGSATLRITSTSILNSVVTLVPISGNASVAISSPQNGIGYIFEQIESGAYTNVDQLEHTDSPNTVVTATGEIEQSIVRSFSARAHDSSDNTWSTFSTINPVEDQAYSITNVNGGNPVIPGQSATWAATGFSPNSATLDGIACLSVSSLGFTPPGYADEANNPRPGNRLLVASEGANTASATVPVGVIPGYKYQTLASVSAGLYSVVKDMDADIGDFVVYPDADGNNVTTAGELETNHEGSQVFWLIKGDTGYGLSYNVLTGAGGELIEVNRSLTAKSLTMSGLTMRSLTARGL